MNSGREANWSWLFLAKQEICRKMCVTFKWKWKYIAFSYHFQVVLLPAMLSQKSLFSFTKQKYEFIYSLFSWEILCLGLGKFFSKSEVLRYIKAKIFFIALTMKMMMFKTLMATMKCWIYEGVKESTRFIKMDELKLKNSTQEGM